MMAEAVGETQDVYRPNVSSYDAPNMAQERIPIKALALDTLSIFSGSCSADIRPADCKSNTSGCCRREGRAVRVQTRTISPAGDDKRELRPGRAVESTSSRRTQVGNARNVTHPACGPESQHGKPIALEHFTLASFGSYRLCRRGVPAPLYIPSPFPHRPSSGTSLERRPHLGRPRGLGVDERVSGDAVRLSMLRLGLHCNLRLTRLLIPVPTRLYVIAI